MRALICMLSVLLLSVGAKATTKNQEVLFGQKAVAKCEKGVPSHVFCEVHPNNVPGDCGHGFECVLLKAGEKQRVCGVDYACLDKVLPKLSP